jgi:hypothetical protein
MATINQSSGQGALFELVARGVKDHYFVKDSKESVFPYDARYESSVHHLAERKTIIPLNDTAFGQTFEVEIDAYGVDGFNGRLVQKNNFRMMQQPAGNFQPALHSARESFHQIFSSVP